MRKYNKRVKKGTVLALLFALLLTMAPVSVYADELDNGASADAGEGQESLKEVDNEQEKTVKPIIVNEQDNPFESVAPDVYQIDFKQNGMTVKNDSLLQLSVYVRDDSEIADIRVGITSKDFNGGDMFTFDGTKGENPNEYILTYQLDGIVTGRLEIDSVEVVDEHSNWTGCDVNDPATGEAKYWVDAEAPASEPIHVKNFTFAKNGQTIDTIDEMTADDASLETDRAIDDHIVYLCFEGENKEECLLDLSKASDDTSNTLFNYLSVAGYVYKGKYVLKEVFVTRGVFGVDVPLEMDNKEDYSFTVNNGPSWEDHQATLALTSVVLDKNGQQVKQGDEVAVTVGVANKSGGELPADGTIDFYAAAPNVDKNYQCVDLIWGNDGKYHGTLSIEDMYPCEWYVESIDIGNNTWSESDFPDKQKYPYYVCVYNGEAFVNPAFDVDIRFYTMDEEGYYTNEEVVHMEKVERRQTLKEIGAAFPKMQPACGLQQIGWMDDRGREITEDTPLFEDYCDIYAKYDKGSANMMYIYPDAAGEWQEADQVIFYDYEQVKTYADLLKMANEFVPEDITKEYTFSNWEFKYSEFEESELIPNARDYISLVAKFNDVVVLRAEYTYYDQDGEENASTKLLAVEEGTTVNEVKEMMTKTEPPQSYKGLRFKKWTDDSYLMQVGTAAVKNGEYFAVRAEYENCLVRYIIDTGTEEKIFCQTAEKGETVTALTTFDNLGKITWRTGYEPEKTFVVNEDMTFYGSAEDSDTPQKPGTSDKPSTDKPSEPGDKPDVPSDSELPGSAVDAIVEQIKNAQPEQEIKVSMNTKTVVSKEILEAAKGKDVTITLEMDGYSWSINGKDIDAMELKDIDLKVIKNTNHIPSSTEKALAGSNPCMQITLVHEGHFGFKATLNIGVGAEHAGKYGNLYYHDSVGKMVFINAGQIGADGNVSLTFSHASDYLLVMSDQPMSQADVPANLMPAGNDQSQNGNGSAAAAGTNGNVRKSAKTGDNNMICLWMLLCAAAMGAVAYTSRKRQA